MAVPGRPFVTERIIRSLCSCFFTAIAVKFFGEGKSALAAKVFPLP
jgi:hypothetical protein